MIGGYKNGDKHRGIGAKLSGRVKTIENAGNSVQILM